MTRQNYYLFWQPTHKSRLSMMSDDVCIISVWVFFASLKRSLPWSKLQLLRHALRLGLCLAGGLKPFQKYAVASSSSKLISRRIKIVDVAAWPSQPGNGKVSTFLKTKLCLAFDFQGLILSKILTLKPDCMLHKSTEKLRWVPMTNNFPWWQNVTNVPDKKKKSFLITSQ